MGRGLGRQAQRSFWTDARATTAVEFALLAMPFLALLSAIIETASVLLVGSTVHSVTDKLARTIQTGQLQQAGATTADALRKQFVCPSSGSGFLPSFLPCSALIVDVRTVDTYADADVTSAFYNDPSTIKFCPGGAGALVVLRVAYVAPVFLPVLAYAASSAFGDTTAGVAYNLPGHQGWVHLLTSSTIFQNEQSAGPSGAKCS